MKLARHILILLSLVITQSVFAQGSIEDLMITEVDNINPVYKPVVGGGVGMFTFLGDVRDPNQNGFNGTPGYKVNVATFIDNKHYIRANFFFMGGTLSGNERSSTDLMRNLNFKSDIMAFGVNLNYDFDNFFKTYRAFHPFISVGFETVTFNSKIDSLANFNGELLKYHYWSDGGIYNMPELPANIGVAERMQRDFVYETDLRGSTDWGNGTNYPQYTFAIPIDVGFDFWLSNRLLFRVGTSYHFTFTDLIDHVSSTNTSGVKGNSWNDDFMFTYVTMHLDLFSSKKTLTVERLFADVEWDPTLMGDEDYDGAFDGFDHCPGTPFGVQVDSLGCPLDDDFDGIPNYMDDEPNSRYGAYVDDRGVEISESDLIALLNQSNAVARKDVELYIRKPSSYASYKRTTSKEIPEKFKSIDTDGDGYISFDEMMSAMDKFFDFESDLTSDDIYELNDFFFSQ